MNQVKITETVLRDGHQSLMATRLKTSEMLPILEEMDQVGYYSLEVWGGATFDACIRFLNEDPWERLREIRKRVKNTKLQMLLRGQNLLGYKHYPDDVVDKFIEKSIENGIDIIRIFDALNDIRNLKQAVESTKKYGGHCQCAISYTTSDVHTVGYYIDLAKDMEAMGADSICIKDMAGILMPDIAYELIKGLKDSIKVPIELHTHCTSGIALPLYMKAIEAGIDILDTAISPFSGGTSQPSTEVINTLMKGMTQDPKLNTEKLQVVADYFKPLKESYRKSGILNPKVMDVEPMTLKYQVPGGMLSNLLSQMAEQGAEEKYEDVLKEIPRVRRDLGFPPLVTPLSQMVGTQAMFNVIVGERYKMIPKEIKDYVKGLYGKSPAPISDAIRKKIIGDASVIDYRPADDLAPTFKALKKEYGHIAKTEEDVLSCALFPQTAIPFLEGTNDAAAEIIELNITV